MTSCQSRRRGTTSISHLVCWELRGSAAVTVATLVHALVGVQAPPSPEAISSIRSREVEGRMKEVGDGTPMGSSTYLLELGKAGSGTEKPGMEVVNKHKPAGGKRS